jgi:hypothetical protein
LLQFTADSQAALPSKHIILTSDPDVRSWIKSLPFGGKVSLAGVVDNSIPAFERMMDPHSTDSPLNKALKEFANDKGCKRLMGDSTNVIPFLKVEIVVDGELTESDRSTIFKPDYGLSSFKEEGTVGTFDKWVRDGTVIGRGQLDRLMSRLSGSLMHVMIKVCKARRLAQVFDDSMNNAGVCGCVLGASDDVQDNFSGGDLKAPFNYALPKQGLEYPRGASYAHAFGKWSQTNTTMLGMTPYLLDHEKILIMNPMDPESRDTPGLRDIVQHRNPLFGFADTSINALTDKALALLKENSATAIVAKQISNAQFTDEIKRVQVQPYNGTSRVDGDIKRIKSLLAEAKTQLGDVIDSNPKAKLNDAAFNTAVEKFSSCLSNRAGSPQFCLGLKEAIQTINKKVDEKQPLTDDEGLWNRQVNKFITALNTNRFSDLWPNYTAGEVKLDDLLKNIGAVKLSHIEFQRGIKPLYDNESKGLTKQQKLVRRDMRKAFDYLASCFDTAYDSAKTQTFDLLKRESITTKMARTELTVDLLAQNLDSLSPPGVGEAIIKEMASKLTCLTQYVVGPAHDQKPPGPTSVVLQGGGKSKSLERQRGSPARR